jgi:hypothetical protein
MVLVKWFIQATILYSVYICFVKLFIYLFSLLQESLKNKQQSVGSNWQHDFADIAQFVTVLCCVVNFN